MENFDRENIDELLEICQICQYFPRSKFCAVLLLIMVAILKIILYIRNIITSFHRIIMCQGIITAAML